MTSRFLHKATSLKEKSFNICLIGKPGSGKGTYGKLLSEKFNCPLIVMGDVLRDHVLKETDIGIKIRDVQLRGDLVDDRIASSALLSYLSDHSFMSERTKSSDSVTGNTKIRFILDGFPRTLPQANIINTDWPEKFKIDVGISIEVPDHVCIGKMLGRRKCTVCKGVFNVTNINSSDGFIMPPTLPNPYPCHKCDMSKDWTMREDDTKDVMERRISQFYQETHPILESMKKADMLINFTPYNGVKDIDILEELLIRKLIK
jgi:adenylate kinase